MYKIGRTLTYARLAAGRMYLHSRDERMPIDLVHKHCFWVHKDGNATQFSFRDACIVLKMINEDGESCPKGFDVGTSKLPLLVKTYTIVPVEE